MESKETEMVSRFPKNGERGKVKLSELPFLWVCE